MNRRQRNYYLRVWALSWPVILSNVSVPLVGAVDTAVVGRLPSPVYIGAVALGATIFSFLYWSFGFLRMSTTGFVAQAMGAEDHGELVAIMIRAFILAIGLGALIVIAQSPLQAVAFWVLEASPEVESATAQYYQVRVWSAPAAMVNYAVLGLLIGSQKVRTALVIQLVLTLTNLVLDLWFVLGLGLGVKGVAAASVLAEYGAALVGGWISFRFLRRLNPGWSWAQVRDSSKVGPALRDNANIFIRTFMLVLAFAHFTAAGARFGDVTLAANAVLMHFHSVLAYGLDGFAHAAESLAGRAYGARDRTDFNRAVHTCMVFATVVAMLYLLGFWVLGGPLIDLMTTIATVREAARMYLPWIIAAPLISVWGFMLDGVFVGATRSAEMRNGMLISAGLYLICATWLVSSFGNHGLWAALMGFMLFRAATLLGYYRRLTAHFDHG